MPQRILPIPKDTQKVLEKTSCDNAYLLLNRYLEGENKRGKPFDTTKTKKELYSKIQRITFNTEPHKNRFHATLKKLSASGFKKECFTLKTDSRMVVGLGDANALEVGLTLHPLYGFPYIPGSSLKGLCRSWLEIAEDTFETENGKNILKGKELKTKIQEDSLKVFGSADKDERVRKDLAEVLQESQLGDVTFFDAIPAQNPSFEIDIMTPHYGEYYQDPAKNPPADWYSPNPIKFLTVAPETEFVFGLASRSSSSLEKAKKWFINGLCELGIGAKTSSGYGYFLHPDIEKKRREEEEKRREAAKSDLEKENEEIREKEQKAKEEVDELSSDELIKALEKQIIDLITSNNPSKDINQAYKLWKSVFNENKKIELAKLFFEKQSKYMKKKLKFGKAYAKELKKYADKSSE